ncbi:prolipoprotein diacylglyceryl transferase family protein [Actinoplanes awajinensis]|uniref:prolipoprotein diacylglyceryl transferase family protein n=1 Tax=Actinoplanes awajinensis TaxID=135946 RepID=UPI00373FCEFC
MATRRSERVIGLSCVRPPPGWRRPDPCRHPKSGSRGVASGPAADPGVRVVHPRRDLRRSAGHPQTVDRPRRAGRKVLDISGWAVPFGIAGGRLYHVLTDLELYFAAGRQPIKALYIWDGGLGIWGAVALGALGAWIGCRRAGSPADRVRRCARSGPGAGAGDRPLGQLFNQELFGGPTTLPWGLRIDPAPPTPRTSPPTTRRSCASHCGAWPWSAC